MQLLSCRSWQGTSIPIRVTTNQAQNTKTYYHRHSHTTKSSFFKSKTKSIQTNSLDQSHQHITTWSSTRRLKSSIIHSSQYYFSINHQFYSSTHTYVHTDYRTDLCAHLDIIERGQTCEAERRREQILCGNKAVSRLWSSSNQLSEFL